MTDPSFGAALSRLWPRAPQSTTAAIAAIAEPTFARGGVETPLRGRRQRVSGSTMLLLAKPALALPVLPTGEVMLERRSRDRVFHA